MPTIKCTDRARAVAPDAEIERLALSEIKHQFGEGWVFPAEPESTTEIRLYFTAGGGNWLVALPLGVDLWLIDTVEMRRLVDKRELRFAQRCTNYINQLGWKHDDIEALARSALAQANEDDHFVPFARPLEVVRFLAWQEGAVVEIDIDDAQVAA
jgi:hypothetical protein